MTRAQRSAADSGRYKVTGDVHLVLLDDDGQVLLSLRKNTGIADGCYHLPAGHLEAGESVIDALVREAREETGLVISPDAIDFAHVMHSSSSGGRVAFFFTVRRWDGIPQNREPDKCSELRWVPLNAPPGNLVDYCRSALAAIADGKPFSIYGWKNPDPPD
jgi:8-oxo-dGTP diphosphatase